MSVALDSCNTAATGVPTLPCVTVQIVCPPAKAPDKVPVYTPVLVLAQDISPK